MVTVVTVVETPPEVEEILVFVFFLDSGLALFCALLSSSLGSDDVEVGAHECSAVFVAGESNLLKIDSESSLTSGGGIVEDRRKVEAVDGRVILGGCLLESVVVRTDGAVCSVKIDNALGGRNILGLDR